MNVAIDDTVDEDDIEPPGTPPSESASEEDDDMGLQIDERGAQPVDEQIVEDEFDLDSGDDDDGPILPAAFPLNPPMPDDLPPIQFPPLVDGASSSTERNRKWARTVRDSFVAYQSGMRGDSYKRRCNYEHMVVMGYVY